VAAIFSARLLNGESPLIYEDGEQRRDFVSVHDIVQALLLAAERPARWGGRSTWARARRSPCGA
jgi:dTDP-L-rhamnose 4-epimerase